MGTRTKTRSGLAIGIAVATLALAGTIALAGCSGAPAGSEDASMGSDSAEAAGASSAYRTIDAAKGQAMMDAGDVTVVDVRTAQEYADGHIPGAVNIPVETIGADKPAELTDTGAELIVYCRTGVRSKQASDKLVALGYQHVNDMGGIVDWTGPTVSGSQPDGS